MMLRTANAPTVAQRILRLRKKAMRTMGAPYPTGSGKLPASTSRRSTINATSTTATSAAIRRTVDAWFQFVFRDSTGVPEKHGFNVFFGYSDQVHAQQLLSPRT